MKKDFNAQQNYEVTQKAIGYVPRKEATQADYDRIGFMSGLEVHQQLKTKEKLFCRCPAGRYHDHEDYDAEIIRHMRPTLSELGEYDGTALMEFKTRKEIIYRIKNDSTCTYEIDDTPPFKIDKEALEIALEISLLCKFNIVGEVHITRKQYLDGSIPAGFQRTAILGVEGEIPLKNKTVRLIQLSIEEDSCREVSDIGHVRIYKTDRLGMPLIETVTYPDMANPVEVMEAANYIRFMNRSTGKVRTGIGAGREDVNVSCKGGTRVEIKGVAHNKWIPELTHNECFRQWALLHIREELLKRVPDINAWKPYFLELDINSINSNSLALNQAAELGYKIYAVKLEAFQDILSHFTQPGKCFADEISDRLKVIACIEKPNMTHSEDFNPVIPSTVYENVSNKLNCSENDAVVIFWGPEDDMPTAMETIEERCRMAFEGVPKETRKSFIDGTTIFERVLPGADRMYPDTDSAPIPLEGDYIDQLSKQLPVEVIDRYNQLINWEISEDTFVYILRHNLVSMIEKISTDFGISSRFLGSFLGHRMKYVEGHFEAMAPFSYDKIYDLFKFLNSQNLHYHLAIDMLPHLYQHPNMDFESILSTIKFKRRDADEIIAPISFLKDKYSEIGRYKDQVKETNWVMGQLRKQAIGNMDLTDLYKQVIGK